MPHNNNSVPDIPRASDHSISMTNDYYHLIIVLSYKCYVHKHYELRNKSINN